MRGSEDINETVETIHILIVSTIEQLRKAKNDLMSTNKSHDDFRIEQIENLTLNVPIPDKVKKLS